MVDAVVGVGTTVCDMNLVWRDSDYRPILLMELLDLEVEAVIVVALVQLRNSSQRGTRDVGQRMQESAIEGCEGDVAGEHSGEDQPHFARRSHRGSGSRNLWSDVLVQGNK